MGASQMVLRGSRFEVRGSRFSRNPGNPDVIRNLSVSRSMYYSSRVLKVV